MFVSRREDKVDGVDHHETVLGDQGDGGLIACRSCLQHLATTIALATALVLFAHLRTVTRRIARR